MVAAGTGPVVAHIVPAQKIMLIYSISWKPPHPHPRGAAHLCAHPPLAVAERSTPRRKMQLQLFAFCLSGTGLEVLKTYICVSLDVL